jgi:hypothetical protein
MHAHNQLSMFVASKAKQYPHLAEYLASTHRSQTVNPFSVLLVVFGVIGAFISLPVFLITLVAGGTIPVPFMMLLMSALMIAGGTGMLRRKKSRPDALKIESDEIAGRLRETFDKRWFGRVRPNPSLLLLDECARHWSRVHAALSSAFWRREDLPKHYYSLRDQAGHAADRAMMEALVMASPHLPKGTEKRDWTDAINDVLNDVFKTPDSLELLPVEFAPAREIGEKLRSLAQEVESMTRQVANEVASQPAFNAEQQLDLCIQDIRTVREAEEELRQQTRG